MFTPVDGGVYFVNHRSQLTTQLAVCRAALLGNTTTLALCACRYLGERSIAIKHLTDMLSVVCASGTHEGGVLELKAGSGLPFYSELFPYACAVTETCPNPLDLILSPGQMLVEGAKLWAAQWAIIAHTGGDCVNTDEAIDYLAPYVNAGWRTAHPQYMELISVSEHYRCLEAFVREEEWANPQPSLEAGFYLRDPLLDTEGTKRFFKSIVVQDRTNCGTQADDDIARLNSGDWPLLASAGCPIVQVAPPAGNAGRTVRPVVHGLLPVKRDAPEGRVDVGKAVNALVQAAQCRNTALRNTFQQHLQDREEKGPHGALAQAMMQASKTGEMQIIPRPPTQILSRRVIDVLTQLGETEGEHELEEHGWTPDSAWEHSQGTAPMEAAELVGQLYAAGAVDGPGAAWSMPTQESKNQQNAVLTPTRLPSEQATAYAVDHHPTMLETHPLPGAGVAAGMGVGDSDTSEPSLVTEDSQIVSLAGTERGDSGNEQDQEILAAEQEQEEEQADSQYTNPAYIRQHAEEVVGRVLPQLLYGPHHGPSPTQVVQMAVAEQVAAVAARISLSHAEQAAAEGIALTTLAEYRLPTEDYLRDMLVDNPTDTEDILLAAEEAWSLAGKVEQWAEMRGRLQDSLTRRSGRTGGSEPGAM
uniref:Uncharacterized protein n=1 Tax=viral metagenome TaxID=1070528 RepID=A0A2V0RBS0_9ZZZZ